MTLLGTGTKFRRAGVDQGEGSVSEMLSQPWPVDQHFATRIEAQQTAGIIPRPAGLELPAGSFPCIKAAVECRDSITQTQIVEREERPGYKRRSPGRCIQ